MAEIYLVSLTNENWDDSTEAFRTREEAVAYIAGAFEIGEYEEAIEDDSEEFWEAVEGSYASGGWKSFQFLVLNTETLVLTDAAGAP